MRNNKLAKISDHDVSYGKLPPQAVDIEEAVLAALLVDMDALEQMPELSEGCFYKEENRLIFLAIKDLYDFGVSIDVLTVTEQLRKRGELEQAGGSYGVTMLSGRVASAAHINHHVKTLREKNYLRGLIRVGSYAVSMAYNDTVDVFELMSKVEGDFAETGNSINTSNTKNLKQISADIQKELEKAKEKKTGLGVHTYFRDIDRIGVPQNGDLIIWAARASMGKTAAMISTAIRQAKNGVKVGIMSMEMSGKALFNRMIAHETGVRFKNINSGDMSESDAYRVESAKRELEALPIYIDDLPNQTLQQFKATLTRMKRMYGIQVAYADHLGKLKVVGMEMNAYAMVTEVVRGVKSLARTLDIPLFLLVQLSRKVEARKDFKPIMSDLRDSGAIEEEADQVGLFFRPEYYDNQGIKGFDTVEVDGQIYPSKGYAEINYAKNRNGETGIVRLKYVGHRMAFDDFSELGNGGNKEVVRDYRNRISDDLPF